jgi:hypothetical protein
VGQWVAEVGKFITGWKPTVLRVESPRDLARLTVQSLLAADLVVINHEVLASKAYLQRLGDFATAGARNLDGYKGRYQVAMYQVVLEHLSRTGAAARDAKGCPVSALEASRRQSHSELTHAVAEKNTTRKGMNELRKKRRNGEDVVMPAEKTAPQKACKGSVGKLFDEKPKGLLQMSNVPLELFEFERVVCDEVSFIGGHMATALSEGMRGRSHICLTGTPGLESTRAVLQLARSVGTVIGPEEMPPDELGRTKDQDQTTAESFRHFLRLPDELRYHQQTAKAAEWLRRFARHNEPQKAAIKVEPETCMVLLSPAEQVLYVEKDRDLKGLDAVAALRGGRGTKGSSLRDQRMKATLLHELDSVQEVLLFQASCVEGLGSTAEQTFTRVRKERQAALADCLREFERKLKDLAHRNEELLELEGGEAKAKTAGFVAFERRAKEGSLPVDLDLGDKVRKILDAALKSPVRCAALWAKDSKASSNAVEKPGNKRQRVEKKEDEEVQEGGLDSLFMDIKEGFNTSCGIYALLKEMGNRQKMLRFFDAVSAGLLRPKSKIQDDVTRKLCLPCDMIVLPCGHIGCSGSVEPKVKAEARCAVAGCDQQNVTFDDLLHIGGLVAARTASKGAEQCLGPWGSKLACLTSRVSKVIKQDKTNRALIFCQLPALMERLGAALKHQGVAYKELDGTPKQMHEAMEAFGQSQGGDARVLLVSLDQRCAGANLTAANYVFFAHPVMRSGTRSASDIEAQAVGRARRFGQTRTVHVVRFVAKDTIEERMESMNAMERKE